MKRQFAIFLFAVTVLLSLSLQAIADESATHATETTTPGESAGVSPSAAEPAPDVAGAHEGDGLQTWTMDSMIVEGQRIVTPTRQTNDTVFTGTEITRKGMEIQGGKTAASVYESMNVLPGVNVESVDPFGLSTEQKTIRVRGVRGYLGSMTVEGVPNYGGNPMGPRDYIYDTENFQGIAVYKGAVPADLGTSVGSRAGAIELKPHWPEEKPSASLTQGVGSNDYHRTFVRIDSGEVPGLTTKISLSYSYTNANKWKGPGNLGPRNNVNVMISQPITEKDEVKIWANYNEVEQYFYRPLTYAESQSLSENYRKDYNSELSQRRMDNINYYRYNKGKYANKDIFGIIPFTFDNDLKISIKPYYSKEDARILQGVTSQRGMVQQRIRDFERLGVLSEIVYPTSVATMSLGYLFESSNLVVTTKNFVPGSFAFAGYGVYTKNDGNGYTHSPYLKLSGTVGAFNWQAGLKYFAYDEPAARGYVSQNTAPYSLQRARDLDRAARLHDILLPSAGLSYNFTEDLQLSAQYGRTQIRPYSYVPLISLYNQYRTRFQRAGVTLGDMFSGYDMEITDSWELGMTYTMDWLSISPSVYFAKHQKLLTTVYDARVNLNYQQNVGDATSYGFELDTNIFLNDMFTVFINPSYTSLTYDKDLAYQGSTLSCAGKQVVDTPDWSLKTGVIFSYAGFQVVPSLRYIGDRYGDVEHHEKIDPQMTADLRLSYTFDKVPLLESVTASFDLYNLFSARTISMINTSDDTRAGVASYYVGPPFTALFQLALNY